MILDTINYSVNVLRNLFFYVIHPPMSRSVGRPRTDAKPIHVRFPPREIEQLDAWISLQPDAARITQAEAIRRIVAAAVADARRKLEAAE
jgi:hypothetical protein